MLRIGNVCTCIGEGEANGGDQSVEPKSRVVFDFCEVDFALFLNRFQNSQSCSENESQLVQSGEKFYDWTYR